MIASSIAVAYLLAGLFFYSLTKAASRADKCDARSRAWALHNQRRAVALAHGSQPERLHVV